ncbi:unnamed protein product [Paramecium octaurelia]|uniref:Uncharacterized protein n=1 Tax=Paramecium octaurelia TaxID=43137 RepID=A0A8S1UPH2_PAROT|nr:unnamed protein product [Paramecium octaurelia]
MLQIIINVIYIFDTYLIHQSLDLVLYRSLYIVWMLVSLVMQKISQRYQNALINVSILVDSVFNILLYFYFMKFVIKTEDKIEDVISYSFVSGMQQVFFAISLSLIQSNYLMQSLTITSYFLILIGIFEQFQNNRLWSQYILLFFTCLLLRQNEKSSRLNYLLIHKKQTNLEECKKLFDDTIPTSIIILELIQKQSSKRNDLLNSPFSLKDDLQTPENRSMNVIYYNKSASIQFETENEDKLIERLQELEMVTMDNLNLDKEKKKLMDKIIELQSTIQKEIKLNAYYPFDYQIISQHHDMQCQRLTRIQDKVQFYDTIVQGCLWEGKLCMMLILNNTTDRELRLQNLKELDNYKDNLLASVSHDLKTPLNVQTIITNVIKNSLESKENIQQSEILEIIKYLDDMLANQYIQSNMINDLIDYSQMKAQGLRLNLTHFDLSLCIQQIKQMFKTQIEIKNLQLIITELNEKIILFSDQTRLQQILFNLISNAIKFTFSGKISIIIQIVKVQDTQLIQFSVQDTGIGIPTQIQNKLFKPYSTFNLGNFNRQGIGLGLVISKNLVGLLGPKPQIELISKENEGSSFTFTIYKNMQEKQIQPQKCNYEFISSENDPSPIKQMPSFSIVQQQRSTQKAKTLIDLSKDVIMSLHILIVDDSAFNLHALKLLLKKRLPKSIIDQALNGKEAVEKAQKQQFDLIFMDIQMPIMNGIEAIELIRKCDEKQSHKLKRPIICILSGGKDDFDHNLTKTIGADLHLEKPLSIDDLRFLLEKFQLL